jgi:hypothetical protein
VGATGTGGTGPSKPGGLRQGGSGGSKAAAAKSGGSKGKATQGRAGAGRGRADEEEEESFVKAPKGWGCLGPLELEEWVARESGLPGAPALLASHKGLLNAFLKAYKAYK